MKEIRASEWIDALQSKGTYTFTRKQALEFFGGRQIAVKRALARLSQKRRIVIPRHGFYVIVPVEYKAAEAPPASWFIDPLMHTMGRSYYVGLLSAAALHGAAHQQPQELQVMTDIALRSTQVGRSRIRFFRKKHLAQTSTLGIKVETGKIHVSTPEATALDLIRYYKQVGGLSQVATVLQELAGRMSVRSLLEDAKKEQSLGTVQRLGFLLQHLGHRSLARPLAVWLAKKHPSAVRLKPERQRPRGAMSKRWNVLINEPIETDQ
jgi:predicted transcriptional regulator of viral defense system